MDYMESQVDVMSRAVQAKVEESLEQEFEKLKEQMVERVENLVDGYKKAVMKDMKITVEHEPIKDNSKITFDIEIDTEEIRKLIGN